MLTNIRRFVVRASPIVSGVQSCHAVGLSRWDLTYGLLLSPQRFLREMSWSLELDAMPATRCPENVGLAGGLTSLGTERENLVLAVEARRETDRE
jgi:hypothetical protein